MIFLGYYPTDSKEKFNKCSAITGSVLGNKFWWPFKDKPIPN